MIARQDRDGAELISNMLIHMVDATSGRFLSGLFARESREEGWTDGLIRREGLVILVTTAVTRMAKHRAAVPKDEGAPLIPTCPSQD